MRRSFGRQPFKHVTLNAFAMVQTLAPFPDTPITHLPTGLIAAYKGGTHGHYSSKGFPIIKLFLTNMIYDVVSEAWKSYVGSRRHIEKSIYNGGGFGQEN